MSRLAEKYGHRGASLLTLGAVWIFFGLSVLIEPQEPRSFVLHEMLPVWLRATLWVSSGLFAMWVGTRGHDYDDTWGMVALVILPVERLVSFGVSWAAWLISSGLHQFWPHIEPEGYERGWYAVSIWALIVTLLRVVAGWPNAQKVMNFPGEGGSGA